MLYLNADCVSFSGGRLINGAEKEAQLPSFNYMHEPWRLCHCDVSDSRCLLQPFHTLEKFPRVTRAGMMQGFLSIGSISFLSSTFSAGLSPWYVKHCSDHWQISKRSSVDIEVALSQPRCISCLPLECNASFIHWQTKKLPLSGSCRSVKSRGAAAETSRWCRYQRSLFFC